MKNSNPPGSTNYFDTLSSSPSISPGGNFTKFHHSLWDYMLDCKEHLNESDVWLIMWINRFTVGYHGYFIKLNKSEISRELGCHRNTISLSIKNLTELGFISVVKEKNDSKPYICIGKPFFKTNKTPRTADEILHSNDDVALNF